MASQVSEVVARGANARFSLALLHQALDAGFAWGPGVGPWARWQPTVAACCVLSFPQNARARFLCSCIGIPLSPTGNHHGHRSVVHKTSRRLQCQEGVFKSDDCSWVRAPAVSGLAGSGRDISGRLPRDEKRQRQTVEGHKDSCCFLCSVNENSHSLTRSTTQRRRGGRYPMSVEQLQASHEPALMGTEWLRPMSDIGGRVMSGLVGVRGVSAVQSMSAGSASSGQWVPGVGQSAVRVDAGAADCPTTDAHRDYDNDILLRDGAKMWGGNCVEEPDSVQCAVDHHDDKEAAWSDVPIGPLAKLLTAAQIQQISKFIDILLDWNKRMNLTTVIGRSAAMERHVEDSLALLPIITSCYWDLDAGGTDSRQRDHALMKQRLRVVDVGTGPGLPGVILAIAKPEWDITLVDSMSKRCRFLEEVLASLALENATVVCSRAEAMGTAPVTREFFDVAVARAVAELRVLVEFCLPLVKVGGLFVAAKGPSPEEEVEKAKRAISVLGGQLLQVSHGYTLVS